MVLSPSQSSTVHLTDCKATFGSHVQGRKLQPSEKVQLHHDDVIKFGQGQGPTSSKFRYGICVFLSVAPAGTN